MGCAQTKLIKKLGGGARLRWPNIVAKPLPFASDLMTTRNQLERGKRIIEIMKQKQYAPYSVAEQG